MAGKNTGYLIVVAGLACLALLGFLPHTGAAQGTTSRYFPETQHSVKGDFLKYWQDHGGLAQQGYPLTVEFTEVSDLDGKSYTVQYFERAVFEKHSENPPPHDVLLSQLGTFQYKVRYGEAGAPNQQPNMQNGTQFPETGYYVGGAFLDYWLKNGGLVQQGFPISNEFTEVSDLDGKTYTVQYFERAVFEMHPEQSPPYNVLLSQLGTFQLHKKYPNGAPDGNTQPQPTPQPQPSPQPTPQPQPTQGEPAAGPTNTPTGTNCEPVAEGKKTRNSSAGPVEIVSVEYRAPEKVTIRNKGSAAADIGGWSLRDKNDPDQRFTFPGGIQLPAGGTVEVYTEPGHQYSFNSRSQIWNNCGDALELVDGNGAVVATYAYGTHLIP